jgi:DNA-binding response OmpR family regulator
MDNMDTIWSVDDDRDMSEAIGLMLKLLGFNTRFFSDARSATRALLGSDHPVLLLLDINMPEVSGLEMLQFIRSRAALKRLPVLMLSANATDTDVERALQLGANGYLVKPVSLEELEQGIRAVLGRASHPDVGETTKPPDTGVSHPVKRNDPVV